MVRSTVLTVFAGLLLNAGLAQAAEGKKYALLVGVREYEHRKLRDLKYTENDVEEVGKVLRNAGFDKVVLLTSTRGKKADTAKPTAANIREQMQYLLKDVTKRDVVLIGLAGHGVQYRVTVGDKDKDESFFCPADAKPQDTKDLAELSKTMLPLGKLFKELDDSGAGSRLLLVDACRNDPKDVRNLDVDSLPRPANGTAVLFSCKSGEVAHETAKLGKGHGVFFHYVLEGLKGKARNEDAEVTWDQLTTYVKRQVMREVPKVVGGGVRQTPHLLANVEGDPVLIEPWVRLSAGWEGLTDHWTIKDGVLTGSCGQGLKVNTFLCSKKKYKDFELKFKVRLKDGKGNSGVQIRCEVIDRKTFAVRGPQADMGEGYWGSLWGEQFGGMITAAPKDVQDVVKSKDFNDYYIKVVGKRVTIKVNDVVSVDEVVDKLPSEGVIAFQIHAREPMEVAFKDIEFTDLTAR